MDRLALPLSLAMQMIEPKPQNEPRRHRDSPVHRALKISVGRRIVGPTALAVQTSPMCRSAAITLSTTVR
jgi:hypothetical protein